MHTRLLLSPQLYYQHKTWVYEAPFASPTYRAAQGSEVNLNYMPLVNLGRIHCSLAPPRQAYETNRKQLKTYSNEK